MQLAHTLTFDLITASQTGDVSIKCLVFILQLADHKLILAALSLEALHGCLEFPTLFLVCKHLEFKGFFN